MADLPGPKMRVGTIYPEPVELRSRKGLNLPGIDLGNHRGSIRVTGGPALGVG